MAQHRLASAQLKAIKEARQQVVDVVEANRLQLMTLTLARVVGVGVETATVIVCEVFSRFFKDRRAWPPPSIKSEGRADGHALQQRRLEYGEGISKNGNPRVRRMLSQLAWRWLIISPRARLRSGIRRASAAPKGA